MIDTLRILVTNECNLNCKYCCNKTLRHTFIPIRYLHTIPFGLYGRAICITGGEPLLHLDRVKRVVDTVYHQRFETPSWEPKVILYTNGLLLNEGLYPWFIQWGIDAVNIGLHNPAMFDSIIERTHNFPKQQISVRYHIQDIYEEMMLEKYPDLEFKLWTMNDCYRSNELIVSWEGP